MSDTRSGTPRRTPLYDLHVGLGAKMVPFAGYEMPVQYPAGVLAEHLHTRAEAGLFDVSHMGQITLRGDDPAGALETLVPGDIAGLAPGAIRYTMFTNDAGGILDDLMVTSGGDHLFLVVNAACKDADLAHLRSRLPDCDIEMHDDLALIALQGPKAAEVLARHAPECSGLGFMRAATMTIAGVECRVSRSGYTGEDGFEISLPAQSTEAVTRRLLDEPEAAPIGLGARDSLRLEAGLCLYGHDIDTTTTPVEAGLIWTISQRRRTGGGFPGAETIQRQIAEKPARRRVGILPDGRAPAREHTPVTDADGAAIGEITSGGFGPSVGGPVAMGYVAREHAAADSPVMLTVRGKPRPARVTRLPFAPHRYRKD